MSSLDHWLEVIWHLLFLDVDVNIYVTVLVICVASVPMGYLVVHLIKLDKRFDLVDNIFIAFGVGTAILVVLLMILAVAGVSNYHLWMVLEVAIMTSFLYYLCYRSGVKLYVPVEDGRKRLIEVIFFAAVFFFFVFPATKYPVPGGTDPQVMGLFSMSMKMSDELPAVSSLEPLYDLRSVRSPGYFYLVASLSRLTTLPVHKVMMGLTHFLAFTSLPLMYVLAYGVTGRRWLGILSAASLLWGRSLVSTLWDGGYTSIAGLAIAISLCLILMEALKDGGRAKAIVAGVCFGSLMLTHEFSTAYFVMAVLLYLILAWICEDRTIKNDYIVVFSILAIGFIVASPWLISVLEPMLQPSIKPFHEPSNFFDIKYFNGLHILIPSTIGFVITLFGRRKRELFFSAWFLGALFLTYSGHIDLPFISWVQPFMAAWRAFVIPIGILSSLAIYTIYTNIQRIPLPIMKNRSLKINKLVKIVLTVFLIAITSASGFLYDPSSIGEYRQTYKNVINSSFSDYGPFFSSHDDVKALEWIRDHTPKDAVVLNPGSFYGWYGWISERRCVFFRYSESIYFDTSEFRGEMDQLWKAGSSILSRPSDLEVLTFSEKYNVIYVFISGLIKDTFIYSPYCQLVYDSNGSRVYEITSRSERQVLFHIEAEDQKLMGNALVEGVDMKFVRMRRDSKLSVSLGDISPNLSGGEVVLRIRRSGYWTHAPLVLKINDFTAVIDELTWRKQFFYSDIKILNSSLSNLNIVIETPDDSLYDKLLIGVDWLEIIER